MKVQIRDSAALSSISISSVRAYLNSQGWTDAGIWGERPINVFATERHGRTWEILVPHRDTIGGYAENMAETVAVLAAMEDRSQLDIFNDLSAAGADVIRLRSMNGIAKEPLSLRRSADLLRYAYDMVAYAARAVESPRAAYRGGLSSEVAEYLDKVRPIPGYYEGYSLTLHSPVAADIERRQEFWGSESVPFARLATDKLASALDHAGAAVSEAVSADSLEPFGAVVKHGVSANLCGSVAELAHRGKGVEIHLGWAGIRPAGVPNRKFEFSTHSADVLQEAAKFFRVNEPSFDERITAQVVGLEREPHEFDGKADLLAHRDGRLTRIKVEFAKDSYDNVIQAFKDQTEISLSGDIHRVGNTYELHNPRNLIISEQAMRLI